MNADLADKRVVLSLCDLTGNLAEPWIDAGYTAVLVDPQHGVDSYDGQVMRLARTLCDAMAWITDVLRVAQVVLVAAFPPCTDLAVSGARWFERKRKDDPLFQARAGMLAEICRCIGRLSGAPYFVENPVSVLSSLWGKPNHTFQPWHYTGWEAGDNYTKTTCLWTGNGFELPPKLVDDSLPLPDDRIHKAPPSATRANFRSATPMGFSRALFAQMHAGVEVA